MGGLTINGETVLFMGESSVSIPRDSFLWSDPVATNSNAGSKAEIRVFIPEQSEQPSIHWYGRETAWISTPGNHTYTQPFPRIAETDFRVTISAVNVITDAVGIVAIGDSITDGSSSPVNADMRWTDIAWRELTAQGHSITMANAGIGGDRLLRSAGHTGTSPGVVRRLDTHVFELGDFKFMILAAGLNDLAWPGATLRTHELASLDELPTAREMTNGYVEVIERARRHGIDVIGATITSYAGANAELPGFYSLEKEELRQTVNTWIRTSQAFAAVIDFDALLRDPQKPSALRAEYDSGDHIHPSKSGFIAMGELAANAIAQLLSNEDNVINSGAIAPP